MPNYTEFIVKTYDVVVSFPYEILKMIFMCAHESYVRTFDVAYNYCALL